MRPSSVLACDLREQLQADKVQLGGIHPRHFRRSSASIGPIFAAVHGSVFEGGIGLAASAHIVAAHPEARFGLTEVRIGYWPVFVFRAVEHGTQSDRS